MMVRGAWLLHLLDAVREHFSGTRIAPLSPRRLWCRCFPREEEAEIVTSLWNTASFTAMRDS